MYDRLDWSSNETWAHTHNYNTAAIQTSFKFSSNLFHPYLRCTLKVSPSSPTDAYKVATYRYSFTVICHI